MFGADGRATCGADICGLGACGLATCGLATFGADICGRATCGADICGLAICGAARGAICGAAGRAAGAAGRAGAACGAPPCLALGSCAAAVIGMATASAAASAIPPVSFIIVRPPPARNLGSVIQLVKRTRVRQPAVDHSDVIEYERVLRIFVSVLSVPANAWNQAPASVRSVRCPGKNPRAVRLSVALS